MALTTGVVNGNSVLIYLDGVAVACSTNAEINYTNETITVTCKDNNGAAQFLMGSANWTMTLEMFAKFDAAFGIDDLWDLVIAKTEVEASFSNENAGDFRLVGNAFISNMTSVAPLNGGATASITLQGTGTLAKEVIT